MLFIEIGVNEQRNVAEIKPSTRAKLRVLRIGTNQYCGSTRFRAETREKLGATRNEVTMTNKGLGRLNARLTDRFAPAHQIFGSESMSTTGAFDRVEENCVVDADTANPDSELIVIRMRPKISYLQQYPKSQTGSL